MPLDSATFSKLVKIYQAEIDSLIQNLGKPITLYFQSTNSNVNDKFYDQLRAENPLIPDYKKTIAESAPTRVENTRIIKALVKWITKDFESYGQEISIPKGTLRLKTFLTDVPDLQRCDYIIPNSNSTGVIEVKYKLLRQPQPVGLQEDRYAITYWEIVP